MTPPRAGGARSAEPRRSSGRSGSSRQGSAKPKRAPALMTPPEALRRLGVTPRKALGQHFLLDAFILGDLADAWLHGTLAELTAYPATLAAVTPARILDAARRWIDPARRVEGIVRGRVG